MHGDTVKEKKNYGCEARQKGKAHDYKQMFWPESLSVGRRAGRDGDPWILKDEV